MSVISATNITNSNGLQGIQSVNFSIEENEKWAIVGDGANTALLRCLLGLDSPDSGYITFGEKESRSLFLEDVGVMWGEANLPLAFTAKQVERIVSSQYETWDSDYYYILLNNLDIDKKKPLETPEKARDCMFASLLARHPCFFVWDQWKSPQKGGSQEEEEEEAKAKRWREKETLYLSLLQANTQLFTVDSTEQLPSHITHLGFMKEGQLLLTGEKDKILRDCAIVDCAPQDIPSFSKEDYLVAREGEGVVELLVEDRFDFFLKYPTFPFKDTTLGQVSELLLQGGTV